jgi:lipopolysaccharide-binding protein
MERAVQLLAMAVLSVMISGASGEDNRAPAVAGIMVTASDAALRYAKEVVVREVVAEMSPVLALPDVKTRVTSPVGRVDAELAHIEISGVNVSSSQVDLGKDGVVTVGAGDVRASIRFHWRYQYEASYVPFPVNDSGWADVQVCV